MRRSPQQLPEFVEHTGSDEESPLRPFVVPGPAALRLSREERDKAEANERRREARLWRERQQLLQEEEEARCQRELQEQLRRRAQLEEEGRSKLFETVAAGTMVGMTLVGGSDTDSLQQRSSDDGADDDDDELLERPTPSPEVVQQRIAGRRELAEARAFAEMGPSMASAAIAQFEAGLGKLMPLLRVGPVPDPTLRDEVMQAVDAMEKLRQLVRSRQTRSSPSALNSASSSARSPAEADTAATTGASGSIARRRAWNSEPHTATSPMSPKPYSGDGMSQPWVSSFNPGVLSLDGGKSTPHVSQRSDSVERPVQPLMKPGDVELELCDSLGSLLGFVDDLHSAAASPSRVSRSNKAVALPAGVTTTTSSPIRLPASPRETDETDAEQRAEGLRQSIVSLYQLVNPTAIKELPGVFARYRGREAELWSTVCRKYDHDPTDRASLLASPAAAPTEEQPTTAAAAAQPGHPASSQDVRRSMTLEHTDVAPPPSAEFVLGASMARWLTREATAAEIDNNADRDSGGHLKQPVSMGGAVAASERSSGATEMSLAEAAAAAARAPATPTSPNHSPTSSAETGRISPYTRRSSLRPADCVDVPDPGLEGSSTQPQWSLPKRLDPGSPHRPPPGRMAYTGSKGHGTKATVAAAAKVDREIAAARVVQRAWLRWSSRANAKARKWKKELELLRWRIKVLRRDGEDLAAEELEAKLREVLTGINSVKLHELDRRGEPKRRGGVSAFGKERLNPWHQRVHRQTNNLQQGERSRKISLSFSDDGQEDEEGTYDSDDSHESWRSWEHETARQPRTRLSPDPASNATARGPHRRTGGQHSPAHRQAASAGKGVRRGSASRRRTGKSDRVSDRDVYDEEHYSVGDNAHSPCRYLPFSDDEDDSESDADYYYNAHDTDIHEFASQLGSFLGGAARDEEHTLPWRSGQTEEKISGKEPLGPLDLSPREQVLVTNKSGKETVGSDALMLALQSLEREIGVGNKLCFR